jgi:hypothetical protein
MKFQIFILCLIAISLVCALIAWLKPEEKPLPPPQPDERDSIRRFREICDLEET